MSNTNELLRSSVIKLKTEELLDSMTYLSDTMPSSPFFGLSESLKMSAMDLPNRIEQGIKPGTKIDKIRSFIKANGLLEGAKGYLYLVDKLKLGETKHLVSMINELSELMSKDLPQPNRKQLVGCDE
jgi:hypothetical protein